jgi:DNA-binding NarL/FixJ family response regulator
MIVSDWVAECSGCVHREIVPTDQHPKHWPAMIDPSGTRYFCSHACLLETAGGQLPATTRRLPLGITPNDIVLLREVAGGYTNGEIAAHLNLAESTVKNRLSRMYATVHAPTRIELVLRAHALGLLNMNILAQKYSDRAMAA